MRIVVIAHNIRSTHNVGAIFRTAEGFGVEKIYLTGYSPYPSFPGDPRLPHLAEKIEKQIHKTALGAERFVSFEHQEEVGTIISRLKHDGFDIIGLEQTYDAVPLNDFVPPSNCALLLGEEVKGIHEDVRSLCGSFVEIPMHGLKESFNVSVATGIALYAFSLSREGVKQAI